MARRRKSDTEKTLQVVIWLLLMIPIAIITLLKWLFTGIAKTRKQPIGRFQSIDLEKVDQMDGFSFEYYVAELLKKNNFKQVLVTSKSGDFGVDITAYKSNKKYAFQCKNYARNLGVSPIQEVYSGAPKYDASVCVVVTNSYFTPHAKELAKKLNVILWDRTELARLIRSSRETSKYECSEPCKQNKKEDIHQTNAFAIKQDVITRRYTLTNIETQTNNQQAEFIESVGEKWEESAMATTLSAGKYVFGVDIPEGKYNIKAVSGSGMLQIQKLVDGIWDEEWINFGVEDHCARTYHGLTLPKNKYFEITGNVVFEITKATMINIE